MTTHLKIDGMTCLNCATHIEKALEAVQGVRQASVSLDEGATVEHDHVSPEVLVRAVRAAGDYTALIVEQPVPR